MKVGILCEGERTDGPVLEELLTAYFPNSEFLISARDKKSIFTVPHVDVEAFLQAGCRHIVILWDLLPVGSQMAVASQWSEKPNRREQRETLLNCLATTEDLSADARVAIQSLQARYEFIDGEPNPAPNLNLQLVCVCYTMDGWLLSDESTLKYLASTPAHPVDEISPAVQAPDLCMNPAGLLTKMFKGTPNRRYRYYNKHTHNIEIVRAYIARGRVKKLRASSSFARLTDTLHGWGAR